MGTVHCQTCDTTRVAPTGASADATERCTMCEVVASIPSTKPGSPEEVKLFDTILTLATRADRARTAATTFGDGRMSPAVFTAVASVSDLFLLFNALSEDQANRYQVHRAMRLRDAARDGATPTLPPATP